MNYTDTPSFYNNEEFFNKYLGNTSYYRNLQNTVSKLIQLINPKRVLELGSALGSTSMLLASRFKDIYFEGIDIRSDIVHTANKDSIDLNNMEFNTCDMCRKVKDDLTSYDVIFMLYSFHHIPDPLSLKEEFLMNCYNNMKQGSYLIIGETFLPENGTESITELFRFRSLEGYASTFWSTLNGLTKDKIKDARGAAQVSMTEEAEAGTHVQRREDEYLIEFSTMKKLADKCHFNIVMAEPVNCINEKIIVLQR